MAHDAGDGVQSLETKAYAGHDDFFARLGRVLVAVDEIVAPPAAERIGVRYTQRVTDPEDLLRLTELVRPEVLGASAVRDGEHSFALCLTQAQSEFDDASLTARWGLMPPKAGIDAVIPPLEQRNWLMDIDVFDERRGAFAPPAIIDRAFAHWRAHTGSSAGPSSRRSFGVTGPMRHSSQRAGRRRRDERRVLPPGHGRDRAYRRQADRLRP